MQTSRFCRRSIAAATMLGIATVSGHAQQRSLVPAFSTAVVRAVWDNEGGLRAGHTRAGDELMITVRRISAAPVESGWAGVCIQNSAPVSLQSFTHATAQVEVSAPVVMDIKLERTRFEEGTLLLADHGLVPVGRKVMTWNLRNSDEVVGSGTLTQTRRMCFYVLADNFPSRQDRVTVKVSRIRFDRLPS
jgi:hypothetical protein